RFTSMNVMPRDYRRATRRATRSRIGGSFREVFMRRRARSGAARLKPSRSMLKLSRSAIARLKPSRSMLLAIAALAVPVALVAQNPAQPLAEQPLQRESLNPAPSRAQGEGLGPYKTMVVRGAMLIDGTGGPPRGPVDIVVAGNRIASIRNAGTPGLPLRPNR